MDFSRKIFNSLFLMGIGEILPFSEMPGLLCWDHLSSRVFEEVCWFPAERERGVRLSSEGLNLNNNLHTFVKVLRRS